MKKKLALIMLLSRLSRHLRFLLNMITGRKGLWITGLRKVQRMTRIQKKVKC
jgi:3'-phosphoadenosine 5'-phosphosulfate sulfotransferase (PAPS reductase)/FAD synthetase